MRILRSLNVHQHAAQVAPRVLWHRRRAVHAADVHAQRRSGEGLRRRTMVIARGACVQPSAAAAPAAPPQQRVSPSHALPCWRAACATAQLCACPEIAGGAGEGDVDAAAHPAAGRAVQPPGHRRRGGAHPGTMLSMTGVDGMRVHCELHNVASRGLAIRLRLQWEQAGSPGSA